MMRYDLHCHSTRSDGTLSPAAVVERAAERGVQVLALTDHDEVAGLDEARDAARECGIGFVDAAELSVTWHDTTLHVVALGIDPSHAGLANGLDAVRKGRDARARRIGESLAAAGIPDAFDGALAYVTSERLISRTHFARHLIEAGHARDMKDAFKRFLTSGKPGHVPHAWATLPDALGWIHGAGGAAVIAHPGRYKLSPAELRALVAEFRDLGGDALEIVSPSHTAGQYKDFAALARRFGLKGSCGTDFHGPGESRFDFGELPPLPPAVDPVWAAW
ncbi:MAG TPA: 3',5'-nucleoside bisphosphate phosphatase [Casimicrobiaceae bacterium]|nr:3',5'-nucleoside bisphosphate phosphatase [Casimicrobiaceae bacterium]